MLIRKRQNEDIEMDGYKKHCEMQMEEDRNVVSCEAKVGVGQPRQTL